MKPIRTTAVARQECFWRTADGRRIPLSEMHNRHLQNTERFLRGGGSAPRNVDMDTSHPIAAAILQIYGDHMLSRIQEHHQAVRAELERRGLPLLPDHPRALERHPPVGSQPGQDVQRAARRRPSDRVHEAPGIYALHAPAARH